MEVLAPHQECYQEQSIDYDKAFAALIDMGYEGPLATKAIENAGSLDVAIIIEFLSSEAPPAKLSHLSNGNEAAKTELVVWNNPDGSLDQSSRYGKNGAISANNGAISSAASSSRAKSPVPDEDDDFPDLKGKLKHRPGSSGEMDSPNDWDGIDPDLEYVEDPEDFFLEEPGEEPEEEPTEQEVRIAGKMRDMGFTISMKMVSKAIKACAQDAPDDEIVENVLQMDEKEANEESLHDYGGGSQEVKVQHLKGLGPYSRAACLRAVQNFPDDQVWELFNYLEADKLNDQYNEEEGRIDNDEEEDIADKRLAKRRKLLSKAPHRRKWGSEEIDDEDELDFHRNLKGFSLPGRGPPIPRELSPDIRSAPYFYYENVAYTPKDEWKNIQRHLYDIEPEFVDALNFSPCRRPRGYIHNLPLDGRFEIQERPPMSVQELISARYWPKWDPRVKLNTINTQRPGESILKRLPKSVQDASVTQPPAQDIKQFLYWAKKTNLVWLGPGQVVPLDAQDLERSLGFDKEHTKVIFSIADRVKCLGNSFQVNTVAYHLSVLRRLFPHGIRVLSLFSGIGGAEVALHKLGIFLKVVVSVEINEKARRVLEHWWSATDQKGQLNHDHHDVKELNSRTIQRLVQKYGGFDLIIGGSPCNNLSGNNRCTRVGLAGTQSVAFFEFPRILSDVRECMLKRS